MLKEWNGFKEGKWTKETNVRDFIQKNYTLYEGDDSFWQVFQKNRKSVGTNAKNCFLKRQKKAVFWM